MAAVAVGWQEPHGRGIAQPGVVLVSINTEVFTDDPQPYAYASATLEMTRHSAYLVGPCCLFGAGTARGTWWSSVHSGRPTFILDTVYVRLRSVSQSRDLLPRTKPTCTGTEMG